MAGPPPPPEAFNFAPEYIEANKGPAIIAVICTVTALETIFCLMRLYTRGIILGRLRLDDYLIIISVLFGWSAVVFGVMAVHSGNGRHFLTLTTEQKSGAILWTIVGFCPGIMSFGIPKLAVISLLERLLNPSRVHRIILWCIGVLCILSLLGCVVVLFAQCTPASSQWDFSITDKKCFDKWILVNYAIYAGVASACTDLYLAVYPAFVLFNLQLPLRKKLALSAALGIGSIATVIAIYKTTRLPNLASDDFSYDTSDLVMWTCIEGSTIIIASCIPVLQPLVDRVLGRRFFGSSLGPRSYKKYGTGRSDGGGGMYPSDMEMSNSRSAKRRPPRDPNGLTFLDETKAGSEESILRQEQTAKNGGNGTSLHSAESRGAPRVGPHEGIVRTDVVSVSYGAAHDHDGPETWKKGF
ncbi:uncharacterized protein E0L32_006025 [Thyridium curvatum]|uniref:Rhodopsin domain-containing protein n=1 Tax=Thyridium curvatum TaxID=1093900 RepID=A0A507B4B9_9PEZI|nr:uncharacterized protein E0L32_006025 [Thyridium curvatum]TPX13554.1 hypothetical protein E0L32_006025 [Thyridium curvatum]